MAEDNVVIIRREMTYWFQCEKCGGQNFKIEVNEDVTHWTLFCCSHCATFALENKRAMPLYPEAERARDPTDCA